MTEKENKNNGNKPDIKFKCGRFQISAWKDKKTIPAKNDYDIERDVDRVNICLSVGQRKNNEWVNIPVWFGRSQFGDLKQAVDDFGKELKKLNSDDLEKELEEEVE